MVRRDHIHPIPPTHAHYIAHVSPALGLADPALCDHGPTRVPDKEVGDVVEGALEIGKDGIMVVHAIHEGLLFEAPPVSWLLEWWG